MNEQMERVVIKFGGTSMGSAKAMVYAAEIVEAHLDQNPVVVVSALGEDKAGGYINKTTNQLISCHEKAYDGEFVNRTLDEIAGRHYQLIENLKLNPDLIEPLFHELKKDLETYGAHLRSEPLRKSAEEHSGNGGIKNLEKLNKIISAMHDAKIQSYGERLSAIIFASYLSQWFSQQSSKQSSQQQARAYNAYDIGMITDSEFQKAKELKLAYGLLNKNITMLNDHIPVITGYIGKDEKGVITLLVGRGGSDYSAAVIAAAINARELLIYSDADGMMSADPKLVANARTIPVVTFKEAAELSYFGAKILQPHSLIPVVEKGITTRILNTFNPESRGTTILMNGKSDYCKGFKGITSKKTKIISVEDASMIDESGVAEQIFAAARKYASVDAISTGAMNISFTSDTPDEKLKELLSDLSHIGQVSAGEGTLINVVTEALKETPGMIGKVCSVLGDNEINIELIGYSKNNAGLNFFVRAEDGEKAVRILHKELIEKEGL